MNPLFSLALLVAAAALLGSVIYLLYCFRKKHQLPALVGLFCLAMGVFLLLLDLVLITFTHGMRYIPDYLLFNRLVADTGFAGRWLLTVYIFWGAGVCLAIYLLARKLITKFNIKH